MLKYDDITSVERKKKKKEKGKRFASRSKRKSYRKIWKVSFLSYLLPFAGFAILISILRQRACRRAQHRSRLAISPKAWPFARGLVGQFLVYV